MLIVALSCILMLEEARADTAYRSFLQSQEALADVKTAEKHTVSGVPLQLPAAGEADAGKEVSGDQTYTAKLLPQYQTLYATNSDLAGWLRIDGTVIDYPVMQTPRDEDYYLERNFYGQEDKHGCLIMDTDSTVGDDVSTDPSTNLIIHGHTMKDGTMFGSLQKYRDQDYEKAHSVINFDSLYDSRKYQVIAVFYSQVYYKSDTVFKYYNFFEADTRGEFNCWYRNIKALSLYDTGVTASFGDEFITLSCCSYQVEDGRFVVVGKRI